MVIHRIEMADSGQFTCLAENSAGEARSTADLVDIIQVISLSE